MSVPDDPSIAGLTLSEAIGLLRHELLKARAAGAESDIQLPVESMTVELGVTTTRSIDGKVEFRVPVAGSELGGASRERLPEQRVTVVFGGPVDRAGHPVKVAGIEDWDRPKP
jgi:hypothetical protein